MFAELLQFFDFFIQLPGLIGLHIELFPARLQVIGEELQQGASFIEAYLVGQIAPWVYLLA